MTAPLYDLLLKGGRVLDPASNLDAMMDVAISGDRIAKVAADIPASAAAEVRDAKGLIVTPGLIDLHVHVYQHVTDFGLNPDDVGVNAGVTTVVDQGSVGAWTFDGFKVFLADTAVTEVLCFLSVNLTGTLRGSKGGPVGQNPTLIDLDVMQKFIAKYPAVIRGIKGHGEASSWSNYGSVMLQRAREIADRTNLPLYIHTGELWKADERNRPQPDSVLPEVLHFAKPGDLLAHCYSNRDDGILGKRDKPSPELLDALASGVHLDLGHGVNFSFDTAHRMVAAGLFPYTISTDAQGDFTSHNDDSKLDFSLCGAMSKMMALGMDLGFVVRATTQHPAEVLRMSDEIGSLKPGSRADISVLEQVQEPWMFRDRLGGSQQGKSRLLPRLVVCKGKALVPSNRLLRDVVQVRDLVPA